jgi:shikimate kinase
METPGNIFLVGPMGAGKSAVGRQLAKLLHMDFADSDAEVEARTGVDIAYIFEKEGDAGFRLRESSAIEELSGRRGLVLATGGGAILNAGNRTAMQSRGTVVYLRTSVDEQLARTSRTKHRPLLRTEDPRAVLSELMQTREPLYLEVADLVIDTDGRRVPAVAREICNQIIDRSADG